MLGYKRSVRVAELIQQEISKIVARMQKPKDGLITITGVKLTDDLESARVYYSVIGTDTEVEAFKNFISDSAVEIRHQLAVNINMRKTPALDFKYDETLVRANRIFEILENIKKEEE